MGNGQSKPLPRGVTIHHNALRISFAYRGVRCRESLGLKPTKTNIEFARRKREVILHEIATGTFCYASHFPNSKRARIFGSRTSQNLTVGELLQQWLETSKPNLAPSTYRDYRSAVDHHLIPTFGDILADSVRRSDIKKWLASLSCSNKRKNNLLIPLRAAFADAVEDEILEKSPAANLRNLEVRQDEPDPFSLGEIETLLRCFEGQARNLFQFAIWSGLRTSELIALAWEDVDLANQSVRVRRACVRKEYKGPKTASGERDVDLLPDALAAIRNQQEHTYCKRPIATSVNRGGKVVRERIRPVFCNPRTNAPWETDQQIRRTCWDHGMKRSKLRYRTPYQTRHTYASLTLSLGANPMWVAQQMGHRDWGMIRKRYGRWIRSMGEQQKQLVVSALEDHCGPIAAPRVPKAKKLG